MMNFGFYNMDCMKGMKEFPDGFFSLAIVDPPYGINANKFGMGDHVKGRGDSVARRKERERRLNQGAGKLKNRVLNRSDCEWDTKPPGKDYFKELFRVSRNQIIWGGNYFELPPTRGIVVWDKMQPWENFSQVEIAWTSFDVPAKLYRQSNSLGNPNKIHPTQKPIELYTWLLKQFAGEEDIVLDTHVGSASSLISFHRARLRYVGFEIDETYFTDAEKRLEQEKEQISIFEYMKGER